MRSKKPLPIIDFENLDPDSKQAVLRVRQTIIDVALDRYPILDAPPEFEREKRFANFVLCRLLPGNHFATEPVGLLKQTGMSEEEIADSELNQTLLINIIYVKF